MSESMIERVARVLEPQAWAALSAGDSLAYKNRRTSSLRKARLILAAMREPTEAMVKGRLPRKSRDLHSRVETGIARHVARNKALPSNDRRSPHELKQGGWMMGVGVQ